MKIQSGALLLLLALGGCATAGFQAPPYSYYDRDIKKVDTFKPDNMVHVQSYLRGATDTFDRMIRQSEGLKLGTELPIIAAGVFAPTWLALGQSTDGAIYAAGVGAAGGALSSYLGLRDRAKAVALARSAITCVNREYVSEMTNARSLASGVDPNSARTLAETLIVKEVTKSLALSASTSVGVVQTAGEMAVAAADDIISKLKITLAGMGSTPDYSSILKDLQDKQKLAEAQAGNPPSGKTALTAPQASIDKNLQEYPVRIALCVAKIP